MHSHRSPSAGRRLAQRLLPSTGGLALLALFTACGGGPGGPGGQDKDKDEERFQADPRTLVEVAEVGRGDVSDFLVSTGTVESEAQVDLIPEASGTVTEIRVDEGDTVRRGQVLAVIENANLEAALARADSELTRARAEHEKIAALHAQGVVSDRELADAGYSLRAAETGLAEARSTQRHTRLTSPISGTVSVRDLRYGEVAGGQRAFQIVDLSKLRVVVKLPERDLPRLREGLPATLASVYDEDVAVAASLTRISPTVDPQTGTVRATVELEPGQTALRPGQFVSVQIEVDRHEDVVVLPRKALLYEEGAPLAFRVRIEEPPEDEPGDEGGDDEGSDEGGGFAFSFGGGGGDGAEDDDEMEIPGPYRIARKVDLEIGFVDDEQVEIVSGLTVGESVVVAGHASLRDEARVRYLEDPRVGDGDPEDEGDDEDGDESAKAGGDGAEAG